MNKENIYNRIDADDEMTDAEKREEYSAACEDEYWDEMEREQD